MNVPRRLTRRRALTEALGAGGALVGGGGCAAALGIAGCGTSAGSAASPGGSTLRSTWSDPVGDGQLRVTAGEPLRERLELGPRAAVSTTLATFAHVTDAHVLDASSPARVSFLDRLAPPFQSTFRPQEALTTQVLAGTAAAVRSLSPELVIQGGDLIDNDQSNELTHALSALIGGRVTPGSGRLGYYGVQLGSDTDPFYYRPAVDAPRHPRLLRDAVRPFLSHGAGAPVYPVLGDHDALVAGTLLPTPLTRSLAVGSRALWDLPSGLALPDGARLSRVTSPDGPPDPGAVSQLLREALRGPTVPVPPDPARRQLSFAEAVARLRRAGGAGTAVRDAGRLDYVIDAGARLRFVVLDIVRRGGGSEGLIDPAQPAWLTRQLGLAGERWVIVVTHQPIASSVGGDALFAVMDRAPRVIAALCGHIHRNQITPRHTAVGGYWLIATASLIDYPQQARAIAVHATADGGVAIRTWMLDHAGAGALGPIARQLSYLDPEGGRPKGASGSAADRNVILHRGPVR